MAQERCNLDKDEAEILRPPSPSPSSASSPQPAVAPPSTRFLMPPQKRPRQREESPVAKRKEEETLHADATASSTGPEPTGTEQAASPPPVTRTVNRCFTCQKRVGLTGFRCRCGELFCPRHRYSDSHGCSFDYKAAGRMEIAKANPVIRAAKIIKI